MSLSDQGRRTVTGIQTPQTVLYSAHPVLQLNPQGTYPLVMRVPPPPFPLIEPPLAPSGAWTEPSVQR